MNRGYKIIILAALIAFVPGLTLWAQDAELSSTKMQAAYYKDHEGLESIVARLLIKSERYEPYANMEVSFFVASDTSKMLLEKMTTNEKGEAIYILQAKDKTHTDATGLIAFEVTYDGNATAESASKDIQVNPADLKVSFFQEDTSKFIAVEAFESSGEDSISPIAAVEIGLYIKGTFSYYNIAKDVTDANGKLIVPFPVEMPGDTLGVITLAAKIEDHDLYGNIESWGNINWAKPVPLATEARRGLGDTDAPLWMVYTLIVLLSAVWFHYAYVIFLVIKIKLAKDQV
ncbi:MAG TPA: hypothetical protein PLR30_14295 [Saprospiraceae bacterium]|jgi:hypothetical protein|nr:hypothetical protein [Saprospiraceae bacterium]